MMRAHGKRFRETLSYVTDILSDVCIQYSVETSSEQTGGSGAQERELS